MPIQLFTPTFAVEECLEEIRECLEKGWTGLGFKTVQFEEAWKEYTGMPYAHFLNSATVGLELAVEVLKRDNGWADDDEIITTPLTFISSNHAILHGGMQPVFADVDEYLCLDPRSVEARISPKTRAVMFVGLGGNTGRYDEVMKLCEKHGLKMILDAAHMAGTRVNGAIPGKDADAVVYSFQAVKNLPTADSGMICFRKAEQDEVVRKLTWLGINKDTYARTNDKGSYKWKYDVEYTGYKYHGNSIMAAIGLVELKYLDRNNAFRRTLAGWYDERFAGSNVGTVSAAPGCESSRHLYQIHTDNRDELLMALNDCEIYPGVHYRDNTEYRMYAYGKGTCPNAHRMSERIMSLPMHLRMTRADVDYIADNVLKYAK